MDDKELAGLLPSEFASNPCDVCQKTIYPAMGYFHLGHQLEAVICMGCLPHLEQAIEQIRDQFKNWRPPYEQEES